MRATRLRKIFDQGGCSLGMWVTMESPAVTEIATVLGLDWVVIDAEHGQLDFKDIAAHLRATKNTGITALVRVPGLDQGFIKRVLDLGAEGIIVPQIQTAGEVEAAVRFAKYPPRGVRGVGADRATLWGMGIPSYTRTANRHTLVIPMIEHVRAGENFDAILDVPGVDAVFFGTCDYAASTGAVGQFTTPEVEATVLALHKRARKRKMPTGLLALDPAQVKARRRQGFGMLGIAMDTHLLAHSLEGILTASGRPVNPQTWHA